MVREYECCNCRKRFKAHQAITVTCAHCGAEQLVRLGICSECFDALKVNSPLRKPFKCPVCGGRGHEDNASSECPACKGTGVVWG